MRIDASRDDALVFRHGDVDVATYVHRPTEPVLESPRPYLMLRTLGGDAATGYRPEDHVWHKGLSLALPNVGDHNFWGGPTYVRDEGYVQLPNNGTQRHMGFARIEEGDVALVVEDLEWHAQDGAPVLREERTLTARVLDDQAWALTWSSRLVNRSGGPLAFGSPTTKGRENAGYAGIFWRGPSAFTGGAIHSPEGEVGDAARGRAGNWLAYVAPGTGIGVLVHSAAPGGEQPWFARSAEFAGLCPAPFFHEETVVADGGRIDLAAVVVVDGADVVNRADAARDIAAEIFERKDNS